MTNFIEFLVWNLKFSCLDCHSEKERLTTDNPKIFICWQCNCYYTVIDSWKSGGVWSESTGTHYKIRRSTDEEIQTVQSGTAFSIESTRFNISGWLEKV